MHQDHSVPSSCWKWHLMLRRLEMTLGNLHHNLKRRRGDIHWPTGWITACLLPIRRVEFLDQEYQVQYWEVVSFFVAMSCEQRDHRHVSEQAISSCRRDIRLEAEANNYNSEYSQHLNTMLIRKFILICKDTRIHHRSNCKICAVVIPLQAVSVFKVLPFVCAHQCKSTSVI